MKSLFIVIDTPALKKLLEERKLGIFFEKLKNYTLFILIPYTLKIQYRRITNIDLHYRVRSIAYRVRILEITRSEEEEILRTCREDRFLDLVETALSTRKHSAKDDAKIITTSSMKAHECGAPKLLVIALGHHVKHFENAKNIIEQKLHRPFCWYSAESLDQILHIDLR